MNSCTNAELAIPKKERKIYKVGDKLFARHNDYTQLLNDKFVLDSGREGEQILELEIKSIKTIKLITE